MLNGEYMERVKKHVKVSPDLCFLGEDEIVRMIVESQAMHFDKHFLLLSGNHSDTFFQFLRIAGRPEFVSAICKEMAMWIRKEKVHVDVVLGPTSAGIVLVHELAKELQNGERGKTRSVYARVKPASETPPDSGRIMRDLESGFEINRGESVFVINDLSTTGTGVETLCKIVEDKGAVLSGIGLFAIRSPSSIWETLKQLSTRLHVLIELDLKHWPGGKGWCKLCDREVTLIRSSQLTG